MTSLLERWVSLTRLLFSTWGAFYLTCADKCLLPVCKAIFRVMGLCDKTGFLWQGDHTGAELACWWGGMILVTRKGKQCVTNPGSNAEVPWEWARDVCGWVKGWFSVVLRRENQWWSPEWETLGSWKVMEPIILKGYCPLSVVQSP